MSEEQGDLFQLHQLHIELDSVLQNLKKGPRQITAREKIVEQKKQEEQDFEAELKQLKMSADGKSLELKTLEKKIDDLKAKLNSASSNREFDTIKGQIEADKMAMSVREDEALELMENVDTSSENRGSYQEAVKAAEADLKSYRSQFEQSSVEWNQQAEELRGKLEGMEKILKSDVRDQYRRLVNSRGSQSMAAVTNEVCSQCHVGIRKQQMIEIRKGDFLFCSTCGALLYIEQPAGSLS